MESNFSISNVSTNPLLAIHKLVSRYSQDGIHLPGAQKANAIATKIFKAALDFLKSFR